MGGSMKNVRFETVMSWIVGTGAVCAIVYMVGLAFCVSRVEAPAWVQAFGSIIAIVIAVMIASWQLKKTNEAKLLEAERTFRGNLLAISSEVKLVNVQIARHSLEILKAKKHGVWKIYPQFEVSYPVYLANVGVLGQIENDELREQIIIFYTSVDRFYVLMNTYAEIARNIDAQSSRFAQDRSEISDRESQIPSLGFSIGIVGDKIQAAIQAAS